MDVLSLEFVFKVSDDGFETNDVMELALRHDATTF